MWKIYRNVLEFRRRDNPFPQTSKLGLGIGIFILLVFSSTMCSSFVTGSHKRQRQHIDQDAREERTARTRQFALKSTATSDAQENVSENNNDDTVKINEPLLTLTKLNFDDVAESPAPPLNYEKYLTMQKKRVPVIIRYSKESGLKPYCLTVAKKVKDEYPDVVIESVELSPEDDDYDSSDSKEDGRTFEVEVDGKLVVRNQKGAKESIFVSMSEMDVAITRARKRRRPSTVYGENGTVLMEGKINDKDRLVKARLEALKQKASELQRTANRLEDLKEDYNSISDKE